VDMAKEPDDPPRKVYGFKEREFKRDNTPSADSPSPTTKDLAMMSGTPAVSPLRLKAPPAARPDDPNDVYAVLQQNHDTAQKHGLNEVQIKEIKSRRKRDFWLVLVGGNLAIIGAVWFSGINVITVIFGLAALIVFSIGLSWIMWQVMDRY
jgi:hypothetical protein